MSRARSQSETLLSRQFTQSKIRQKWRRRGKRETIYHCAFTHSTFVVLFIFMWTFLQADEQPNFQLQQKEQDQNAEHLPLLCWMSIKPLSLYCQTMVRMYHKGSLWRAFMFFFRILYSAICTSRSWSFHSRPTKSSNKVKNKPRISHFWARKDICVLCFLHYRKFYIHFYDKTNLKFVHGDLLVFILSFFYDSSSIKLEFSLDLWYILKLYPSTSHACLVLFIATKTISWFWSGWGIKETKSLNSKSLGY